MFSPYRCQICGETYLGSDAPDRCPYCGAHGRWMMGAAEWVKTGKVEMSEQSYEDCMKAIQLEVGNAAFYKCAQKNAQTQVTQAIFKRLQKQEAEHAELLAEMAGVEEPDLPDEDCAGNDDAQNLADAHAREQRAIQFYLQVADRAPEKRVQEVFRALADIESEHLKISNIYR
ncbi:ferritin family protein [Dethiobacter alkaliphilus]|uniref:ferritin family protein n=1 Tax=Dethiobacter alkaliphilus TaxID=427926 RepID=UPI002227B8B9|nr:ferritin family protein [Dethiobacter alkaliphilus]MCW3489393.1 ferritin-like domain-containing protein [Dethiobacter alkaliphilus]